MHAVDVDEGQLRAGLGAFLGRDQPSAFWPAGRVDHARRLGDPRPVMELSIGLVRGLPARVGQQADSGLNTRVDRGPEGERDTPLPARHSEGMRGCGGVVAGQQSRTVRSWGRGRVVSGSAAKAMSGTAM